MKIEELINSIDLYVVAKKDEEIVGGSLSDVAEIDVEEVLLVTSSIESAKADFDNTLYDLIDNSISSINKACQKTENEDIYGRLLEAKNTLNSIKRELDSGVASLDSEESEKIENYIIDRVKNIVHSHFPDGKLTHNKGALGSSLFFDFSLGNKPEDFTNKIRLNDVMYTSFGIYPVNDVFEKDGKVKLSSTGHNVGGLQINGSKVKDLGWKNYTLKLEKILEKIDSYFKKAKEFTESEEGKEIIDRYHNRHKIF